MPIVRNPQGGFQYMNNDEARSIMGQKGWTINGAPSETANEGMFNESVAPVYPGLTSRIDPNTGLLQRQYQIEGQGGNLEDLKSQLAGVNYDPRGIEALRNEGLRTGPSAWAALAKKNLGLSAEDQLDKNAAVTASGKAQGMSDLAMRGGLSSGARERVGVAADRTGMRSAQDIRRGQMLGELGVDQADEQKRMEALRFLPSAEASYADPTFKKAQLSTDQANLDRSYNLDVEKLNKGGALAEQARVDQGNLDAYKNAMTGYAARQQAAATAANGNSGGKK